MTKAEAKKIVQELDSMNSGDALKELLLDLIERTHREAPHSKRKKAVKGSGAAK